MVPAEMVPAAAAGRTVDDIFLRAVGIIRVVITDFAPEIARIAEVEVGGGDFVGVIPQVPGNGERLQKDLRPQLSRKPKLRKTRTVMMTAVPMMMFGPILHILRIPIPLLPVPVDFFKRRKQL